MTLREQFETKFKQELQKELGVTSSAAVPAIKKITVNMGIGKNRDNKAFVQEAINDMTVISGQKPSGRNATTSISNFKLRKGQMVGLTVTLRGKKMWDFYEKLVKIVLPRVKDFRGVSSRSFDGTGNYNLGLREHIVFPEIDPNKIGFAKSLQVTVSTSATKDSDGHKLLKALGMPFREGK
jgi:large subunit ribosomal protein L5